MNNAFSKSLGIRHVACGSCNGCEHEMNALNNRYYDITQDGWDIVASPRHADVVTLSGPMTAAMRAPAKATIDAVPRPRVVIAIGDCAAGNGPWSGAPAAGAGAVEECGAEIVVAGCPPSPEDIKAALRRAAQLLANELRE